MRKRQTKRSVNEAIPFVLCVDVIVVHCDTPTGALNSEAVRAIGEACSKTDALFYVDMVSSAGAVPVDVSGWNIDIGKDSITARVDPRVCNNLGFIDGHYVSLQSKTCRSAWIAKGPLLRTLFGDDHSQR